MIRIKRFSSYVNIPVDSELFLDKLHAVYLKYYLRIVSNERL